MNSSKTIWLLIFVLVIAWVIGFLIFKTLGFLIHVLLLIAAVLFIYNLYKKYTKSA